MKKREIIVYTKLNNQCENYKIMAIITDDVIKYIDLVQNKMIIDMFNNIISRENREYKFDIDLNNNHIIIYVKALKKHFYKDIEVLLLEKKKKEYLVRYRLIDEDIINEYSVKF